MKQEFQSQLDRVKSEMKRDMLNLMDELNKLNLNL